LSTIKCTAGLYGLVKKFVTIALQDYAEEAYRPPYCIPKSNRGQIKQRGKDMQLTAEFGRPYRCVISDFRLYQLDDWLHFLETFSLYLFKDLLPPLLQEMWQLLR